MSDSAKQHGRVLAGAMEQDGRPICLTEAQVSAATGISLSKLRQDRFRRRGMPWLKIDKSIRYLVDDVVAYCNQHRIDPS